MSIAFFSSKVIKANPRNFSIEKFKKKKKIKNPAKNIKIQKS